MTVTAVRASSEDGTRHRRLPVGLPRISVPALSRDLSLLALLSAIPFLFYGQVLFSFFGPDLQTAPSDFIRALWYSWNGHQNLGADVGSAKGWLFPAGLFHMGLDLLGLPGHLTTKVWLSLNLFLAGASMYYLMGVIGEAVPLLRTSRARLLGSLLYIANPFVILQIQTVTFILAHALLPLQLGLLARGLAQPQSLKYAAGLAVTAPFSISTNPPIVLINYLALALYGLTMLWRRGELMLRLRFLLLAASGVVLTTLWYWLPFAGSWLDASTFWQGALAQESYRFYNPQSSFVETFRLLGRWDVYSGYAGKPYLQYAPIYLQNGLAISATLLPPLLAFAALLIPLRARTSSPGARAWAAYFGLLLVFSIFMAVGAYPLGKPGPTNQLYVFLYDHVPFFAAFRASYKMASLIVLGYAPLLAWTAVYLCRHLATWTKQHLDTRPASLLAATPLVGVVAVVLGASFPMWTGQVFEEQYQFQVPAYWQDAQRWFANQHGRSRIFTLPDQYLPAYTWGRPAFTQSVPWIDKPVIGNGPSQVDQTIGGTTLVRLAYSGANLGQKTGTVQSEHRIHSGFAPILRLMNVGFVLQRNDVDWRFYDVPSPTQERAYLKSRSGIRYVRSFGQLDVYTVDNPHPWIYTPAQGLTSVVGDVTTLVGLATTNYVQDKAALLFTADQDDSSLGHLFARQPRVLVPGVLNDPAATPAGCAPSEDAAAAEYRRALAALSEAQVHPTHTFARLTEALSGSLIGCFATPQAGHYEVRVRVAQPMREAGPDEPPFLLRLGKQELAVAATTDRVQHGTGRWYRGEIGVLAKGEHRLELDLRRQEGAAKVDFVEVVPLAGRPAPLRTPTLTFQRLNPTHYVADVQDATDPYLLVFSESSNPGWRATIQTKGKKYVLADRYVTNGFANSWLVSQTGSYRITIEHRPQRWFSLGIAATSFTLLVLAGVSVWRWRRMTHAPGPSERLSRAAPPSS